MLDNIRIVLISPTHPGNIGAAARAMKTMGLSQLCLVNPKQDFICGDSIARAAGADDILKNTQVYEKIEEAIADSQIVIGTSARQRHLPISLLEAKTCGEFIVKESKQQQISLLFGREHAGLTNEELNLCQYHVHIPTEASFSSLNLAASVQILCYEIRMAALSAYSNNNETTAINNNTEELASSENVERFNQRLEQLLKDINFIKLSTPRKIMARIRRLFNRAQVEKTEYDLLMGILTAIEKDRK